MQKDDATLLVKNLILDKAKANIRIEGSIITYREKSEEKIRDKFIKRGLGLKKSVK